MRDFSNDHRWLSLNTATVRKQGDLAQIVEACARHGIRAIDPWRDQVAAIGLERAARLVRDAGLELSGYCRGGMFTSDAAHRKDVRDDNRRAVDEASALVIAHVLAMGRIRRKHAAAPSTRPVRLARRALF
jgi:sugar phosphate isomerase/epimerase